MSTASVAGITVEAPRAAAADPSASTNLERRAGDPGLPAAYDPGQPENPPAFVKALFRSPPQRFAAVFRRFWPIVRFGKFALVLRQDDVAEVLGRSDVFAAPFAAEVARLNDGEKPGTPFILGIDDRDAHAAQLTVVMQAFERSDSDWVKRLAYGAASEIVAGSGGRLDAIRGLITEVPIEICDKYYGVRVAADERRLFALATITLSGHLFGVPPIVPKESGKENEAGAYVRAVVDRAIEERRNAMASDTAGAQQPDTRASPKTVLTRLLELQATHPGTLTDKLIRAILIGMIVGFVPTNTMAGGHILWKLLGESKWLDKAQRAARDGDDILVEHCLFEALRFSPINLGPFRNCRVDHVLAADTPRARKIKAGTIILASTASAMFDACAVDRPFEFLPDRPASDLMHFGYGMHWCVGVFIARTQITQTCKALLERPGLAAAEGDAGKLAQWALFPDSMHVTYSQDEY